MRKDDENRALFIYPTMFTSEVMLTSPCYKQVCDPFGRNTACTSSKDRFQAALLGNVGLKTRKLTREVFGGARDFELICQRSSITVMPCSHSFERTKTYWSFDKYFKLHLISEITISLKWEILFFFILFTERGVIAVCHITLGLS